MALSDFWRGNRGRNADEGRQGERDWHRQSDRDEGEGFRRRGGWREGSDYYGNNPERYGAGNYDSGASFNDRWQNSYGGGTSSNFRGYSGYGGDDYGEQGTYGGYGRSQFGTRSENPPQRDEFGRRQGQFRGRGPKGYRRSDERIREDVCECLTDDDRIDASNIIVSVKDCEVTLSGTVSTREEKRRAEDLVERLSGVTDVHNQLRVARESEQSRVGASTQVGTGGQGDGGKDIH